MSRGEYLWSSIMSLHFACKVCCSLQQELPLFDSGLIAVIGVCRSSGRENRRHILPNLLSSKINFPNDVWYVINWAFSDKTEFLSASSICFSLVFWDTKYVTAGETHCAFLLLPLFYLPLAFILPLPFSYLPWR